MNNAVEFANSRHERNPINRAPADAPSMNIPIAARRMLTLIWGYSRKNCRTIPGIRLRIRARR